MDKSIEFCEFPNEQVLPENLCVYPFVGLEIDSMGRFAPCCKYDDKYRDLGGKTLEHPKVSIADAWESPSAIELRREFLVNKKPSACHRCWNEEDAGIESMRKYSLKHYYQYQGVRAKKDLEKDSPLMLDIKLGNLCNLKCRICGPYQSSKWVKELKGQDGFNQEYEDARASFLTEKNIFTLKSWLDNVHQVQVFGGEPMYNPEFFKIIDLCLESKNVRKMDFLVNTNTTFYSDEFRNKISGKFLNFVINFSIDDLGPRFEYQRHPAKWREVEKNIESYLVDYSYDRDRMEFFIYCTVSLFNVYYLPEFLEWTKRYRCEVFLNLVHFPKHFAINNLPEPIKKKVSQRLAHITSSEYRLKEKGIVESIVNFMNSPANPDQWEKAKSEIKRADQFRKESFSKTFPEFFGLLVEEGAWS